MCVRKLKIKFVIFVFSILTIVCVLQELRIFHLQNEIAERQEHPSQTVQPSDAKDSFVASAPAVDPNNLNRKGNHAASNETGDGVRLGAEMVSHAVPSTEVLQARGRISVLSRELAEEREQAVNVQSNFMNVQSNFVEESDREIQNNAKWRLLTANLKANVEIATKTMQIPEEVINLNDQNRWADPPFAQYRLYFRCKAVYQMALDIIQEEDNNKATSNK